MGLFSDAESILWDAGLSMVENILNYYSVFFERGMECPRES